MGESFLLSSQFLYYFMVQSLLLCMNTLCFFFTGYNLCGHWRQANILRKSSGTSLTTKVSIIGKLFIIMGVAWLLDVISSSMEHYGNNSEAAVMALDTMNLLTGILVFISLVLK